MRGARVASRRKILVAECEQEISSFNPLPSQYADFTILRGKALFEAHADADTCIRGCLDVLGARQDFELVPVYGASACSAGPLSSGGFDRLSREFLEAIAMATKPDVAAVYLSMHGAMGAVSELDPEGYLLEHVRTCVGPDIPIVVSLDLHGLLTDRMLANCDAIAVYHTYPHNDFTSTGQRAARLLEAILDRGARPVMARVFIPALVRGPELITASGLYGKVIDRAKAMESGGGAMSAAVLIGNPFTDAPELGSQSLVVTDNDPEKAGRLAMELAEAFWADHGKMLADLVPLPEAIADAAGRPGPVTFTDAADAPSSGASGDSNRILADLVRSGYRGRAILPIVDAPAARRAHEAGTGARLRVPLGGTIDPGRFPPLELEVEVERLGDGEYRHEVSRMPAHAGPTAVLRHGNIRIVVVTHPVFMMDRAIFLAHGLDPEQADIIVVKSPGAAVRYFTFACRNYVLDIPGATSANLGSLGHRVCPRPMFPLDDDVVFQPRVQLYPRLGTAA
jgi:microcystin degradation protein MlrC